MFYLMSCNVCLLSASHLQLDHIWFSKLSPRSSAGRVSKVIVLYFTSDFCLLKNDFLRYRVRVWVRVTLFSFFVLHVSCVCIQDISALLRLLNPMLSCYKRTHILDLLIFLCHFVNMVDFLRKFKRFFFFLKILDQKS